MKRHREGQLAPILAPVALALASAVCAQANVPVDPYTAGDPAAMKAAGYVSFGPFPFGERHTTKDVETLLGDEKLHWVETAHFRIGCAVSPLSSKSGDKEWKASLKAELKRLRARLPKVKGVPKTLDPWLRTHLIAQRLEDCYAEMQRDIGATEATFPEAPMNPDLPSDEYMGEGRYLGMKEKFTVLIVRRTASAARYTRAYGTQEVDYPTRMYFPTHGALGVCMAEEYNNRQLENDQALHAQLVFNVAVNLVNGYRSYGHSMPPWFHLGLAHWYSRRVSPKYPVYDKKSKDEREQSPFWQWDERALGLLKFEAFEPVAELIVRDDGTKFGMEEHIQSWFLVDYLMYARKEQMMQFLHAMKDSFHARRRPPTAEEVNARQAVCFEKAFGMSPDALEAEWKKNTARLKHRK